MTEFLIGVTAMGFGVAALFFWRFWQSTRDRFFLFFALAFGVSAVNRAVLAVMDPDDEARAVIYVVRLLSFLLIIAAILEKNRTRTGPSPRSASGSPPSPP
jgi:hypothetical protein